MWKLDDGDKTKTKVGGKMDYLIKGILGILLFMGSIQDIKEKQISIIILGLGFMVLLITTPFINTLYMVDRILGFMIGVIVVILSKITKDKIGIGDGLILCSTGMGLGFWGNLELFAYALFIAAIVSIVLLSLRKVDKKYSLPFVPFLMLSYLVILVLPYIS